MTRLAIDPVTRVGGGLRIELDVADGVVTDAWSSGTMFRGMETILRGRDARTAGLLAERVCGSCSGVHGLASVRALEHALGVAVPRDARLLRDLLMGSEFVLDHVIHFYGRQALDWIEPTAALKADPTATSALARSMSPWLKSDTAYFREAKGRLSQFIATGGWEPFFDAEPGTSRDEATPETALLVMAHYLEALDWGRRFLRLQALLGGKSPHPQTYLVGGMALSVPWGGPPPAPPGEHPGQIDQRAPAALGVDGLAALSKMVTEAVAFVDGVYIPDVLAIAATNPAAAGLGAGIGNYLAFGEFPLDDSAKPSLLLPRGRIMGRDMASVESLDQIEIGETVAHSHYTYGGDDAALRHPAQGLTDPRYGGPAVPFTTLAGADRYSWLKAPRYRGEAMEVGPLARVLVAYVEGQRAVRERVDDVVGRLDLGPDVMFSTLGRMLARAIEAGVIVARLGGWLDDVSATLAAGQQAVVDLGHWAPETWPSTAAGWSLGEGPGGAVGHWMTLADGRVGDYQIVDGSTWNASPRDGDGGRGPLEAALIGTPVADRERPIEVLRTVRSFDPCLACAVH
jgi:Ni,Fe-hydrogenase I large subunit